MSKIKVGLVLSGGGAKGAYQVGVLKALLELGTQIDAVAGASIGALNAAILASAPSLKEGVNRLEELWETLANTSPLSLNLPAYLTLLLSSGLKINGLYFIEKIIKSARSAGLKIPSELINNLDEGLLSSNPIQIFMNKYFDTDAIKNGLPLYVSVYKSQGSLKDLLKLFSAELGILDSSKSEFIHIQSLPQEEQKEALLASAAIPLLFAPRKLNDTIYCDGGMGGWQKSQGNTPITPLLQAGIKTVLVTHLSDGSLWSRHDFPEATILEIRPQKLIQRDGGFKDVLGFDRHKIPSWIEQGYQDTLHCVGRVMDASKARNELHLSEFALASSGEKFNVLDNQLSEAMARLQ